MKDQPIGTTTFPSNICNCQAIATKGTLGEVMYILKREGFATLFNGLRFNLVLSAISLTSNMLFYERIKKEVGKLTTNRFGLPLISAAFARFLATTLIFPLDFWRTQLQGSIGRAKKTKNFGAKVLYGFSTLQQRDILFSCAYWIFTENFRLSINNTFGVK